MVDASAGIETLLKCVWHLCNVSWLAELYCVTGSAAEKPFINKSCWEGVSAWLKSPKYHLTEA